MEANGFIEKIKSDKSKNFYVITKLGKNELKVRLDEFKPIC